MESGEEKSARSGRLPDFKGPAWVLGPGSCALVSSRGIFQRDASCDLYSYSGQRGKFWRVWGAVKREILVPEPRGVFGYKYGSFGVTPMF